MDMICKKCGEDLTGKGLIAWIEHSCNTTTVEYKVPTSNEMREFFMEIGMPKMVYEAMGYAVPTKMEKRIYEDNSSIPKHEPQPQERIITVATVQFIFDFYGKEGLRDWLNDPYYFNMGGYDAITLARKLLDE